MAKKYYWLKLKEDFFRNKKIKKLRKIAGGDTFTIIYLKMQLLSLKNNGSLIFEGVEENFAEEIALEIDEDVDNVKVTTMFLLKNGLLEETEQDCYVMTETLECIGKESDSAERVRKHRKLREEQQKALQCNASVTNCNTEIEKEIRERNNIINTNVVDCDYDNEFELLWKEYPNKKGKAKALTFYKKARKNGTTFEEVQQGIVNYNKEIEFKKTDKNYIKHGSTWFNNKSWTDEYEVEEVKNKNKPTGRRVF